MEQTLTKVKNLEKFIKKYGEDAVISQTITKMLDYKIRQYDEDIKKMNREISRFERKYRKESSVFINAFEKGDLGDNMDFVEWASLYKMRNRLTEKNLN